MTNSLWKTASPRRLAAVLMVIAVVLANVAFLGLGSVFNYPDILQESASAILAEFREDQGTIITLFVVLAISAALLAPIAVLVGRLAPNELGRWSIGVGIAAAVVQVIGLLRWPLIVPFLADRRTPTHSKPSTLRSARSLARRLVTSLRPRGLS